MDNIDPRKVRDYRIKIGSFSDIDVDIPQVAMNLDRPWRANPKTTQSTHLIKNDLQENEKIKKRNESVIDKKQKEKLRRGLKKGSSFAFEILVDCSKIEGWNENNYIEYLKEAEQFFRDRFEGQEIISSVVHMDESKPHLHITFSYYNKNLKK